MKTEEHKKDLVRFFGKDPTDTGSPEVQIALLTKRIKALRSLHFKFHRKDKHSFLGLKMLISKKERLLRYLGRLNVNRYDKMMEHLGPSNLHADSSILFQKAAIQKRGADLTGLKERRP
ncbi:30S ribosomal subunit protein S15 [Candidatus Tremblaya phenacola PAVE]|nr:30S ribosomal subunit protein S15 [Candidatus Tremblaya phenacola PAVE]